jgi:nitroimidazol reductase NimA-like FMN-containing flavoprotein (pyridoxamine 5'-phosphate oxidase superfamily)
MVAEPPAQLGDVRRQDRLFVYEGGDLLYLHTGAHQGHFLRNVQATPRICLEVSEIGPLHPGKPYACNSALVYTSVVAFGPVRIEEAAERKSRFFDRLLAKCGPPEAEFEPGYPLLDRIILYEMRLEVVTGKRSLGLRH